MPVTFLSRFSVRGRLPGAAVALLLACAAPLLAPGTAGASTPAPSSTAAPSDAAKPASDTAAPETTQPPSGKAPSKAAATAKPADAPRQTADWSKVTVKISMPSKVESGTTLHAKLTVTNTSSVELGRIPLRAVLDIGSGFSGDITGRYRQPDGSGANLAFGQDSSGAYYAAMAVAGGGHPGAVSTVDLAITFDGHVDSALKSSLTVGVAAPGGGHVTKPFTLDRGAAASERMKLSFSGLPGTAVRGQAFTGVLRVANPTDTDFSPGAGSLFLGNAAGQSGAAQLKPSDVVVELRSPGGTFTKLKVTEYSPGLLIAGIPRTGGKPQQIWSGELRITVKTSAASDIRKLRLQFGMGTGFAPKPAEATVALAAATAPGSDSGSGSGSGKPADHQVSVSLPDAPAAAPVGPSATGPAALPKTGAPAATPALVGAGGLLLLAGAGAVTASRARRRPRS